MNGHIFLEVVICMHVRVDAGLYALDLGLHARLYGQVWCLDDRDL
jgi:hypothetical protein